MPGLDLKTNVTVADEKAFCVEFSKVSRVDATRLASHAQAQRCPKFAADTLGKPESYISVSLDHSKPLTFKGTFEPAFLLTIVSLIWLIYPVLLPTRTAQISLDNLQPEKNEKYSKAFFEFFKEKLGVPGDRGYVYVTHSHHKHRSGIESEDSTFIDPGRSHIGYVALTFALLNYVADIQCRRYQGTTFQALWS